MRTHFRCPGCGRLLEKGAAAFVLGWAGYKPKDGDPLPETVTCPGCGEAIPTKAMIAGAYDEKPDWLTPVAGALGLVTAFGAFYGPGYKPMAAVGLGLGVCFAVLGAADLIDRLRRR